MTKFSENIKDFKSNLDFGAEHKISLKRIPKSEAGIQPGSIVFFRYYYRSERTLERILRPFISRPYRVALVVANQRGTGVFTSTRHNLLMSCFILQEGNTLTVDGAETKKIINDLYKERDKASYSAVIDELKQLFPEDKYRTFNLASMSNNIWGITLSKEAESKIKDDVQSGKEDKT